MKPKFKLLRSEKIELEYRWLRWEMVAGDPFYSTHLQLWNKPITPGSVVSLTNRDFWGEKND